MDLKDEKSDEKLFETVKSNELSMTANLLESNKSIESFKNKKMGKIAKSFLENKSNNESNTQSPFHTPISTFKPTPKGLLLDMEFKLENQSKKHTNTITNTETNNIVIEEEGKDKICADNIYFINSFEEKNNLRNDQIQHSFNNSQMEIAIFIVLYISDDFLKKKFSQYLIGNKSNASTKTTYHDSVIGKEFKEPIIIKEKFIVKTTDIFKFLINAFIKRFNIKLLEYGLKLLELDEINDLKKLIDKDLSYSIKNLKKNMKPDIDLPSFDQSTEIGVFKIDKYSLVYSPDLLTMPHNSIPKLSFSEEIVKLPVTKSQVYSEDSSSSNSYSDDESNNKDNRIFKERRPVVKDNIYNHDIYEIDNLKANNKNLEDSGVTLNLNNSSSTNKMTKEKDSTPIKIQSGNKIKSNNKLTNSETKEPDKTVISQKDKLINKRLVFDESKESVGNKELVNKSIQQNDGCCSKCIIF